MLEIDKIYNENCLVTMSKLDDNSIDMVLTSPPYDNLRSYKKGVGDNWNFETFKPIAQELARVIKNGGVIVWVVGDQTINYSESGNSFRQALYFKDVCGLCLYDTMIYQKKNVPLTHKRYEQSFEYMFIFSKGKIQTFNAIMKKSKYYGQKLTGKQRQKKGGFKKFCNAKIKSHCIKGNIWKYSVEKWLVILYSRKGIKV